MITCSWGTVISDSHVAVDKKVSRPSNQIELMRMRHQQNKNTEMQFYYPKILLAMAIDTMKKSNLDNLCMPFDHYSYSNKISRTVRVHLFDIPF